MDRLYQTTGVPNTQQIPKHSEIYYQRFKELSSQPESTTNDHQSSRSAELSDSTYTFQHRVRPNTQQLYTFIRQSPAKIQQKHQVQQMKLIVHMNQSQHSKADSKQQTHRSQQSIQFQRNRLIIIRQLGQIIGIPNISLNNLKLKIKELISQNSRMHHLNKIQRQSINSSQHSLTSIHNQSKQIDKKHLSNSSKLQHQQKHHKQLQLIYQKLLTISLENIHLNDNLLINLNIVLNRIQAIKYKIQFLQSQNKDYQQIRINKDHKIRQLQITTSQLHQQISKLKSVIEILEHQKQSSQYHHEIYILKQNQKQYKQIIQNLKNNRNQINQINQEVINNIKINSRINIPTYDVQNTPTFKQMSNQMSIKLLIDKQQQNRLLHETIKQLNQKLSNQIEYQQKNQNISQTSNIDLTNYIKQLQIENELLKRQINKQKIDQSAQNSKISSIISDKQIKVQSQIQFESQLKQKYQEISTLNIKLLEENSLLRTKVDQIQDELEFQKQKQKQKEQLVQKQKQIYKQKQTSQIDQLNSLISDISTLKKDIFIKSQQLQTIHKILLSKQEEIDLYHQLIDQKNSQISRLKSQLNINHNTKSQQIKLKQEIFILQESLKQSINTHDKYCNFTNEQINTLKNIGINLEKQNHELLEMIREYEIQINKLIKNGQIKQKPESLKSEKDSVKFNLKSSEIKKELDIIVASIENRKSNASSDKQELVSVHQKQGQISAKKSQNVFKNPFDLSTNNSAINYSPINLKHPQNSSTLSPKPLVFYQDNEKIAHLNHNINPNPHFCPSPNHNIISNINYKTISPKVNYQQIKKQPSKQKIYIKNQSIQKKNYISPNHKSKIVSYPNTQIQTKINANTISPINPIHNNSQSKLIIMNQKPNSKSKSKQKQYKTIQSPYLISPMYSGKDIIDSSKLLSISPKSSQVPVSKTSININSYPISSNTIQRSPPQNYRSSPYFNNSKNMKSIPQIMQSNSKLSIRLSQKVQISKPHTSPQSIYNIQKYSNNPSFQLRQQVMYKPQQKQSINKPLIEPGIKMFQLQNNSKSDCC